MLRLIVSCKVDEYSNGAYTLSQDGRALDAHFVYMQPLHCSQYTAYVRSQLHFPARRSWRVSFSSDLPDVLEADSCLWVRGCDEDFYEAQAFDIDSESWRLLPLMPHARRGATVVAIPL